MESAYRVNPTKVHDLNPTATDVENLKNIPSQSSDSVQHALKQELPKYVAASEGVSSELGWWKKHEADLPHNVIG